MYLIEYGKNLYINAENISDIMISHKTVEFTQFTEDYVYVVDTDYQKSFVNGINSLDKGCRTLAKKYAEINSNE